MWEIFKALWPYILILVVIKIFNEFFYFHSYKTNNSERFYRFSRRKSSTPEAQKLADELNRLGYNAELEKNTGHMHIDIAVTKAKINIEVDGKQHNWNPNVALSDLKRTYHSLEQGFVTIRIPNSLVKYRLEETVEYLDKILKNRCSFNVQVENKINSQINSKHE